MKKSLLELNNEEENAENNIRNDIYSFLEKVIIPKLSKEKQAKIKALTDKGIALDGACEMLGVKISCIRYTNSKKPQVCR